MGTHDEAQGEARAVKRRCRPQALIMGANLSPPPPRTRLRVGVSGHRAPPKLPAESEAPLRAVLDRVLATIAETARNSDNDLAGARPANGRSEFVVVSSLAEGSDRIVAEAGLAAGYKLEAVLPFARAEYADDFTTPESCAEWTASRSAS